MASTSEAEAIALTYSSSSSSSLTECTTYTHRRHTHTRYTSFAFINFLSWSPVRWSREFKLFRFTSIQLVVGSLILPLLLLRRHRLLCCCCCYFPFLILSTWHSLHRLTENEYKFTYVKTDNGQERENKNDGTKNGRNEKQQQRREEDLIHSPNTRRIWLYRAAHISRSCPWVCVWCCAILQIGHRIYFVQIWTMGLLDDCVCVCVLFFSFHFIYFFFYFFCVSSFSTRFPTKYVSLRPAAQQPKQREREKEKIHLAGILLYTMDIDGVGASRTERRTYFATMITIIIITNTQHTPSTMDGGRWWREWTTMLSRTHKKRNGKKSSNSNAEWKKN